MGDPRGDIQFLLRLDWNNIIWIIIRKSKRERKKKQVGEPKKFQVVAMSKTCNIQYMERCGSVLKHHNKKEKKKE